MPQTFNQPSFAKGELSPELYGRLDTEAYNIGLRTARNIIVHPYGCASNRPGTRFLGPVKNHTNGARLIPFEFKTTDTYVLEFGNQYMRVIRNDAHVTLTPVNITGATQANPVVITANAHGYSAGDEVYISGVGGMTRLNGNRYLVANPTANTFELHNQVTNANINGTSYPAYTSGGTVAKIYEISTPYTIADIPTLKYVQNADVMTLVHKSYPIYELSRTDHTAWTLAPLTIGPTVSFPLSEGITPNTTGAVTYQYKVSAISSTTGEEGLAGLEQSRIMDGATITYKRPISAISKAASAVVTDTAPAIWAASQVGKKFFISGVLGMTEINGHSYSCTANANHTTTLNVNSTGFSTYTSGGFLYQSIESITQANPGVITMTAHGLIDGDEIMIRQCSGMTELNENRYTVTNSTANTLQLLDANGNLVNTTSYSAYVENGLIYKTSVKITNGNATANNTISWTAVSGASRYIVYKYDSGAFGKIGETTAITFLDDNIAADLTVAPQQTRNPFSVAGDYPGAVSYHEQRRVFGGTINNPNQSVYSQVGNTSNFNVSVPLQDDDAITAKLVSGQVDEIRHYVPGNDLIIFTSGAEWRVNSGPDSAFTATTIKQKPQSYWGSSHLKPITSGLTIIYVTDNQANVRSLGYNLQVDGYTGSNLNLFSQHLLKQYQIVDWCYSHAPEPRIYLVRSDGAALTLTFDQEQQVLAWTRWDTSGNFENTCSLRQSTVNGDAVYFVVKRTINGNTVRYIEKLDFRNFTTINDAFFVDCGATYSGSAATTISGLDFLEGQTVVGLADGVVFTGKTVTNGAITLSVAASTVQVGLAFTADLETLDFNTRQREVIGKPKKIAKITIRMKDSKGLMVGQSSSSLISMDQPTTLSTGDYEIRPGAAWNLDGRIFIRQSNPLPMTILDIAPYIQISP